MYQFKIFNVRIDLRFRLNKIHEDDAVSTDEEFQFRLRIFIDLIDSSKSSVFIFFISSLSVYNRNNYDTD